MNRLALILCLALPVEAVADTVVAARTIRSQTMLMPGDLALIAEDVPGALSTLDDALGMEARVNLYAGRPIRAGEIGPAAIIERNQIVTLIYEQAGLTIAAEGRSLARGGAGDRIRVQNLESRNTVTGTVAEDGTVRVSNGPLTLANR